MRLDIITKEDLQQFKTELFTELKDIIGQKKETNERQWLKSAEVRKMLNISAGTLQNLRIIGTLPFRKIGGSMYYNRSVIEKIIEGDMYEK
ncbi:helix-turn-helix domain-containing protein [Pedobacter foliorum]|uniref:helix-turn-helix domain-containing protein n=1 Tax=Pedobacter foliorum TaxID=2739058 RepID=UPI001564CA96|nr:helix-turn-helix domain-containing protein [Pedobacter foliorum]NRF40226.1 helix-turn-helix domain-containing protein [Pedobacter foliorum]